MSLPSYLQAEDLVLNRWDTKNFTIISYDKEQGAFLAKNVEHMKTWGLTRWGLPDVDFTGHCKIVAVPTKELLKKHFNFADSYVEITYDEQNRIKTSALWLVLDNQPADTIPPALIYVCLKEYGQQYRVNVPFWALRGMGHLNASPPKIREHLSVLKGQASIYYTKTLMSMSETDWSQQSEQHQQLFDAEAMALCLLFQQEYKSGTLAEFVQGKQPDYKILDTVFKKHLLSLTDKKLTDKYLNVGRK